MSKRPIALKFNGYTHFTKKWLGSYQIPYDPKDAVYGEFSRVFKRLKKVMFPFCASMHGLGIERIIIKVTYIY